MMRIVNCLVVINTTKQYIGSCKKPQHPRIQSIERMELFLLNVFHIWRRPRQLLSYILSIYRCRCLKVWPGNLALSNTFSPLSTSQTNTTSPMNRFTQTFMNKFLASAELITFLTDNSHPMRKPA